MTTAKHKDEQEEYRKKNAEHQIFKRIKRVQVEDTIVAFKKQSGQHPDVYKSNFAQKDYLLKKNIDPMAVGAREDPYEDLQFLSENDIQNLLKTNG